MKSTKLSALSLALLFAGSLAHAQKSKTPPVEPQGSPVPDAVVDPAAGEDTKRLSFDSLHTWNESRWYIIGRWSAPDTITWLGGGETRIRFPRPACMASEGFNYILRPSDSAPKVVGEQPKTIFSSELLEKRNWVAIEVGAEVASETFEIRSPYFKDLPECSARVTLNYGRRGGKPDAKPLLFSKPTEYFFEHEITIYAPEKPQRANIQLDLYMGYWRGSFPNAAVNPVAQADVNARAAPAPGTPITPPKTSLSFLPTAVSRGEWLLPWYKKIGLTLGLEQTLRGMGGQTGQSLLISDWNVGAFYQWILPALDGIQARLYLKYFEHIADDGSEYLTVLPANTHAKDFIVGGTFNHYFAKRWLVGVDLEYGIPNSMAGEGVTQSYLAYCARLGYRFTSFLTLVDEIGVRDYKVSGYQTESILQNNLGIRLEL